MTLHSISEQSINLQTQGYSPSTRIFLRKSHIVTRSFFHASTVFAFYIEKENYRRIHSGTLLGEDVAPAREIAFEGSLVVVLGKIGLVDIVECGSSTYQRK